MEELREAARELQAEERCKKRDFLQDSLRNLDLVVDIRTRGDMKNCAETLTKKSAITAELLVAVKNGLLHGNEMIKAFLEVNSALPCLLRLFSSGGDARLQILAAHCLCNLALGGQQISARLAKSSGPYLVMHMEGMNPLLTEASLWTVGNISLWKHPFEILHAQGAYTQAGKLLATTSDSFVRSAAAFCLIRALKNNHSLFNDEEYVTMSTQALSVNSPDSAIFLLCSLLAHHPAAISVMAQRGLHLSALGFLQQIDPEDVTTQLSITRILANLVTEPSGQIGVALLSNPAFFDVVKRQLSLKITPVVKETMWLLGNLIQHSNQEVQSIATQFVINSGICCSQF